MSTITASNHKVGSLEWLTEPDGKMAGHYGLYALQKPKVICDNVVCAIPRNSEAEHLYLATGFIGTFVDQDFVGGGTGFFVSYDGLCITAKHVVESFGESDLFIKLNKKTNEGLNLIRPLRLIQCHDDLDLAVLKAPELKEPYSFIRTNRDPLQRGDKLFVLGYPNEYNGSLVGSQTEVLFPKLNVDDEIAKVEEYIKQIPNMTMEEIGRNHIASEALEPDCIRGVQERYDQFRSYFETKHRMGPFGGGKEYSFLGKHILELISNAGPGNSGSATCDVEGNVKGVLVGGEVNLEVYNNPGVKMVSYLLFNTSKYLNGRLRHAIAETSKDLEELIEKSGVNLSQIRDGNPSKVI